MAPLEVCDSILKVMRIHRTNRHKELLVSLYMIIAKAGLGLADLYSVMSNFRSV
jgi:hypothetical protein